MSQGKKGQEKQPGCLQTGLLSHEDKRTLHNHSGSAGLTRIRRAPCKLEPKFCSDKQYILPGGGSPPRQSSLRNLIHLGWVCRSWSWSHSPWPTLTNTSHHHHAALQWWVEALPMTKEGEPEAGPAARAGWPSASYPVLCNSEAAQGKQLHVMKMYSDAGIGSSHHESPRILFSTPDLRKSFTYLWPLGSKGRDVNRPDSETPDFSVPCFVSSQRNIHGLQTQVCMEHGFLIFWATN